MAIQNRFNRNMLQQLPTTPRKAYSPEQLRMARSGNLSGAMAMARAQQPVPQPIPQTPMPTPMPQVPQMPAPQPQPMPTPQMPQPVTQMPQAQLIGGLNPPMGMPQAQFMPSSTGRISSADALRYLRATGDQAGAQEILRRAVGLPPTPQPMPQTPMPQPMPQTPQMPQMPQPQPQPMLGSQNAGLEMLLRQQQAMAMQKQMNPQLQPEIGGLNPPMGMPIPGSIPGEMPPSIPNPLIPYGTGLGQGIGSIGSLDMMYRGPVLTPDQQNQQMLEAQQREQQKLALSNMAGLMNQPMQQNTGSANMGMVSPYNSGLSLDTPPASPQQNTGFGSFNMTPQSPSPMQQPSTMQQPSPMQQAQGTGQKSNTLF